MTYSSRLKAAVNPGWISCARGRCASALPRSCWPCSASRRYAVWVSSYPAVPCRRAGSRRSPASPVPSRCRRWPGYRTCGAPPRWRPLSTAWKPARRTMPWMSSTSCYASCSARPRRKTARYGSGASRIWIGPPRPWPRPAGCCWTPTSRTTGCANASMPSLAGTHWPRRSRRSIAWCARLTMCSLTNWRPGKRRSPVFCRPCCASSGLMPTRRRRPCCRR